MVQASERVGAFGGPALVVWGADDRFSRASTGSGWPG